MNPPPPPDGVDPINCDGVELIQSVCEELMVLFDIGLYTVTV